MENKRVIVFGGCGFLGSYLVEELVNRNYQVTACDISPLPKELAGYDNLEFMHCDILDAEQVQVCVERSQAHWVYNLAGFANLDKAIHHPYRTMELNVMGNINILDACVKYIKQVRRFIFASSAYAMNSKGSFYGISKLASEKIVEEYYKRFQLPFSILRYGSIYSEKPFDNNYIYKIVYRAVKEGKIEHEGDGEEVREYIHAQDAARLSVDIIESEQYENEHIVLTGLERMRRKELFLMIEEILNTNLDIRLKGDGYQHHYKYTPYSFEPAVSKKIITNPYIDMGQGLLRCIKAVYENGKEVI